MIDLTASRIRAIMLDAAAEAHGFRPTIDGAEAPCVCGHRYGDHAGADWDGPCGRACCRCQRFELDEDEQ